MGLRTKILFVSAKMMVLGITFNVVFPPFWKNGPHNPLPINLIQQITVAINNYAARNEGRLPQDIVDTEGRKLWSWRVNILPDLDEQALYDELRLDEPWDGEYNRQFSAMPVVAFLDFYSDPSMNHTNFMAIVGSNTVFGEASKSQAMGRIYLYAADASSIMLVQVDSKQTIPWAKPGDFVLNPEAPGQGLSENDGRGFLICSVDGAATYIDEQTSPETLLALFQVNDGKMVDVDQLQPIDRMDEWRWPGVLGIGLILVGVMLAIAGAMFRGRSDPAERLESHEFP